jgi:hypothetical protein
MVLVYIAGRGIEERRGREKRTEVVVTQDNRVVLLCREEVREGGEISQIVPTYQRILRQLHA